jgi:hypothetical protein
MGISFLEMLNRAGKEFQRFLIMSLPPHHAAVGGVNIAQRDVIIAIAQCCFRLVQYSRRIAILPFLKKEPALQNAHDRGHVRETQRLGQFAPNTCALQGLIVLALLAMAASVPEMRYSNDFLVFNLLLHGEHQIKLPQCFVGMVTQERKQPFCHPELKIVIYGETPTLLFGKARQQLFNQVRLAIADIDPLSQAAYKFGAVAMPRAHCAEKVRMLFQHRNSAGNLAHHQVVLQLLQKLIWDLRGLLQVARSGGHGGAIIALDDGPPQEKRL